MKTLNKWKIAQLTVYFLLSISGLFLIFDYYHFKREKERLLTISQLILIDITRTFNAFLLTKNYELNVNNYKSFLNDNYTYLIEEIESRNIKIGTKISKEAKKIYLYEYGLNNKDDAQPDIINLNNVSYFDFIKNRNLDILIMEYPITGKTFFFEDVFEKNMKKDIKAFKKMFPLCPKSKK